MTKKGNFHLLPITPVQPGPSKSISGGVSGSGTRRSLKKILKSSFERSRRAGHYGAFKALMKRNSDNENLGQSQKMDVGN